MDGAKRYPAGERMFPPSPGSLRGTLGWLLFRAAAVMVAGAGRLLREDSPLGVFANGAAEGMRGVPRSAARAPALAEPEQRRGPVRAVRERT